MRAYNLSVFDPEQTLHVDDIGKRWNEFSAECPRCTRSYPVGWKKKSPSDLGLNRKDVCSSENYFWKRTFERVTRTQQKFWRPSSSPFLTCSQLFSSWLTAKRLTWILTRRPRCTSLLTITISFAGPPRRVETLPSWLSTCPVSQSHFSNFRLLCALLLVLFRHEAARSKGILPRCLFFAPISSMDIGISINHSLRPLLSLSISFPPTLPLPMADVSTILRDISNLLVEYEITFAFQVRWCSSISSNQTIICSDSSSPARRSSSIVRCLCGICSRSLLSVKRTAAQKVRGKTRGSWMSLTCTCDDFHQTAKSTSTNKSHQGLTRATSNMMPKEQRRTRNNFEASFPTPGRQRSRDLKMKSEEDVRQNLLILKRLKFNCSALCWSDSRCGTQNIFECFDVLLSVQHSILELSTCYEETCSWRSRWWLKFSCWNQHQKKTWRQESSDSFEHFVREEIQVSRKLFDLQFVFVGSVLDTRLEGVVHGSFITSRFAVLAIFSRLIKGFDQVLCDHSQSQNRRTRRYSWTQNSFAKKKTNEKKRRREVSYISVELRWLTDVS